MGWTSRPTAVEALLRPGSERLDSGKAALSPCSPAACGLCVLPLSTPAQLAHSQVPALLVKLEQRRWVPSAAQERHRSSCQGLGKKQRVVGVRTKRLRQGVAGTSLLLCPASPSLQRC